MSTVLVQSLPHLPWSSMSTVRVQSLPHLPWSTMSTVRVQLSCSRLNYPSSYGGDDVEQRRSFKKTKKGNNFCSQLCWNTQSSQERVFQLLQVGWPLNDYLMLQYGKRFAACPFQRLSDWIFIYIWYARIGEGRGWRRYRYALFWKMMKFRMVPEAALSESNKKKRKKQEAFCRFFFFWGGQGDSWEFVWATPTHT